MQEMKETQVLTPGWGWSLGGGNGNPLQYSCLENSMGRKWRHWFNGHELEQILGDGEGQGSLVCCSPWGYKESDRTWQLNSKAHLFNHQTIHGLLLDVPQTPLGLFLWQALLGHLPAPLPPQINADTLLAENKRMNFLISTYSSGRTTMPTCQFKYQREKWAYKKGEGNFVINWD